MKLDEGQHAHNFTDEEVVEMMFGGVVTTVDGCCVEPDGKCPHGYLSPLLILGLI